MTHEQARAKRDRLMKAARRYGWQSRLCQDLSGGGYYITLVKPAPMGSKQAAKRKHIFYGQSDRGWECYIDR